MISHPELSCTFIKHELSLAFKKMDKTSDSVINWIKLVNILIYQVQCFKAMEDAKFGGRKVPHLLFKCDVNSLLPFYLAYPIKAVTCNGS